MFSGRNAGVGGDGCLRHRQLDWKRATTPASNRSYWQSKFRRNVERYQHEKRARRRLGWRVLVVWECELRKPEKLLNRIRRFFDQDAKAA